MRRTVNDIQNAIIADLATNGITVSSNMFSRRRIWTFVVASAHWLLEEIVYKLFDEIQAIIDLQKPHTTRWYSNKVKAFQYGYSLPVDSDKYDNTGLTQQQVDASKIVAYCAVTEEADALNIKVAKNAGADLAPLSSVELAALQAYVGVIKDAGVFTTFINQAADSLKLSLELFTNPMVIDGNGLNISLAIKTVEVAILNYLKNLPFNGVFATQSLIDELQKVAGVIYVKVNLIQVKPNGFTNYENVVVYYIPASGYLRIVQPNDLSLTFTPYSE